MGQSVDNFLEEMIPKCNLDGGERVKQDTEGRVSPRKERKRIVSSCVSAEVATWLLLKAFKVCSNTCNWFSHPFTGAAGSECREAVLLTRKFQHAFGNFSFCLESRGKLLWGFEQESVLGLPACTLETVLHRQSDHILKCDNTDIQDYIFRLNLSCRARGLYFTLPQKWKRVAKKQKKTSATGFYLWTFGQFAFYWAFFFFPKFVNECLSDKVNRFVSKLSFRNEGFLSLEAEVKIILFECFIYKVCLDLCMYIITKTLLKFLHN